ncbi:MAG: chloride channel protein, partial [bacterium]
RGYFFQFKSTEHIFMVVVATLIGLIAGFGAVGIQFMIKMFNQLFWGSWDLTIEYFNSISVMQKLLAPAIGGLIVGFIIYFISKEAKGHGVPEVMAAIALKNGIIRARVVFAKLFASSLYIGSGGSVGREGPVIQIGSAVGSAFGQFLQVNTQRMKTFVACGAAAGIAAAFNAPIAGALFSVEVILCDFGVPQFSPIVISSVVATVVSRSFLGDFPAFVVPKYQLMNPYELVPYAGLGIFAGIVALLFINTLHKSEEFFEKIPVPVYIKTVVGGLLVGVLGVYFPHIYGVGYDTMDMALRGELLWQWLLLLVFVKIIATSISLGSGGSGGVFAPSLFLGAMTGGFFGEFVHQFFPNSTATSGAYALVGMGAVVAAATHAPITAILIIFEMTNDYKIILPLMISCIIGTLLSTKLQKESIYTIKLIRRGIDIFKGRDVNVLRAIKVNEIMEEEIETIPTAMPFRTLMKKMLESPKPQFIVVDKDSQFAGIITLGQIRQSLQDEEFLADLVVAHDILNTEIPTIAESESLDSAMKLFGSEEIDILPVVADTDSRKPIGQISRRSVLDAYNKEISKLDVTSELAGSLKLLEKGKTLDFVEGYHLAEIQCPKEFVNKSLKSLHLRNEYNIQVILIKRLGVRGKETSLVPEPADKLRADDKLIIVGPEKAVERVKVL